MSVLGETGNNVMMRLMGLLLMVIAVECFVRRNEAYTYRHNKSGRGRCLT